MGDVMYSHETVAMLPIGISAMSAVWDLQAKWESFPLLLRKLLALHAYAVLTALWAVAVVRRLHPGWARFLAAAPILVGNLAVPLLLDYESEPYLITPIGGVFSLAAFKLLAFCIGRGPLLPLWLTRLQFCGVYMLPIVPIQMFTVGSPDAARVRTVKSGRQLLLDSWANAGTAMLVSWVLALPGLPVMVRHWLYTLATSTVLTAVFDVLASVAHGLFGISSAPSFDKPWLCNSFQDFWARRWNLTTTYMLRVLVYEPVIEGRLLPKANEAEAQAESAAALPDDSPASAPLPEAGTADEGDSGLRRRRGISPSAEGEKSFGDEQDAAGGKIHSAGGTVRNGRPSASKLRTFLGLQAVFLFSGLWHILIFWYNTHVFSWRWCAFFAIQAPILTLERAVRKAGSAAHIKVPHAVQVFAANFLLIAVAKPLFFGPADTTGFAERNLAVGQAPFWALVTFFQRIATHGLTGLVGATV